MRWVVLALSMGLLASAGAEARTASFRVRHRSSQTVYLEGGSSSGLSVGDRLDILRGDAAIGEVEVTFVSGYSASCRVIVEREPIGNGDTALLQDAAILMLASADLLAASPVLSAEGSESAASQALASQWPVSRPLTPQSSSSGTSYGSSSRPVRPPTLIAGTLALEYEAFTDDSGNDLDYDRTQARLNLRGRDVGGLPISLRVRTRIQQIDRARELSAGAPASESRDRLYEVSVRYDAPSGRYSLMGGRLGASPYISIGYLDGLLAQVRAYKTLSVGGFWGNRPDVNELGFDSFGPKYGGYLRFANDRSSAPQQFNVMLGGVREEGDLDVSREYALLETYYQSGGVWSFFQRAEIDVNNEWREELSASASQLSNLALSARARLSESARLVISYDQFRQYRTEETRFVPEELFDDLLRQGLRVGLNFGRPNQLNWSVGAGYRTQQDADESAFSLNVGARHPDVIAGISMSGDLMGYGNLYTEGAVLRLRSSKFLAGGHEIYLDLGSRFAQGKIETFDDTTDTWGRLGFWAELPARLFARGEFEYSSGDSINGTRFIFGLGYRF